MHGHSYEAEIVLTSESLDDTGFVLDYGVLGAIRNKLDHQHLNDIMPGNPTAERLAVFIATLVNDALFKMGYDTEGVRVESVLVKETASSWAMVSF
jgi:6-pyruvoyltetrahydropterin/6-carboxytetrahydropterin synthase